MDQQQSHVGTPKSFSSRGFAIDSFKISFKPTKVGKLPTTCCSRDGMDNEYTYTCSHMSCSLLAPTCRLLAPTYSLLAPTCRLLAPTCRLLAPTYSLLAPTCRFLAPTYSLLAPTCRFLAPATCSHSQLLAPTASYLLLQPVTCFAPTCSLLAPTASCSRDGMDNEYTYTCSHMYCSLLAPTCRLLAPTHSLLAPTCRFLAPATCSHSQLLAPTASELLCSHM
jgi:hypothetical protein